MEIQNFSDFREWAGGKTQAIVIGGLFFLCSVIGVLIAILVTT